MPQPLNHRNIFFHRPAGPKTAPCGRGSNGRPRRGGVIWQVESFEINKIGQGFTATAYKIECKLAGGSDKVVIIKLPHELGIDKQKQHANDCKIEACARLSVFLPGCLPASCLRAGPNAGPKSDGRGGPAGG